MKFPIYAYKREFQRRSQSGRMPLQQFPLNGRRESFGYEICIILEYSFYALVVQMIYAIVAWLADAEHLYLYHSSFNFSTYLGLSIGSFMRDLTLLDGNLPSGGPQKVRIIVDLLLGFAFSDIFPFPADSDKYTKRSLEVYDKFGSILSLFAFIVGLYFSNVAYFACFRALVNLILGGWMAILQIFEYFTLADQGESE